MIRRTGLRRILSKYRVVFIAGVPASPYKLQKNQLVQNWTLILGQTSRKCRISGRIEPISLHFRRLIYKIRILLGRVQQKFSTGLN
jgi:hypothetical protein